MPQCPEDISLEEEHSDTEDSLLTQEELTDSEDHILLTEDTIDTEDEEEETSEVSEDEVPSPKRHNTGRASNDS